MAFSDCVNGYYGTGDPCTPCRAGTHNSLWVPGSTDADCVPCEEGFSTRGLDGQAECTGLCSGCLILPLWNINLR